MDMPTAIQVAVPAGFTVWQLDGSSMESGPWTARNAGTADSPFRAVFDPSDAYWRLLVVRSGAAYVAGKGRLER